MKLKYIKLFENFHNIDIVKVLNSYLESALWTEEERLGEQDNEDFEEMYGDSREESGVSEFVEESDINITNIDPDSKLKAYEDIKRFLDDEAVKSAIFAEEIDEEQLGHDIWLTRNGHGAGFFDRMYDSENEQILTNKAKSLGSSDVYLGDDKVIYFT